LHYQIVTMTAIILQFTFGILKNIKLLKFHDRSSRPGPSVALG